jgi:uncharacterized protein YprB with RNaseH-like and TPR domain
MLKRILLENILFLDIETVPETALYTDLSEQKKQLWASKSEYQRKESLAAEAFYPRAGIWAEFGKIICISVGYFCTDQKKRSFRIKSFHGDENKLLRDFKLLIDTHFNQAKHLLCAHNGKEFDFPYIARRMVIHRIPLPKKLDLFGKKPWEIPHLDTLELWKFGDFKSYTSLKLLTLVLGIKSPKSDMDGSAVYDCYYKDKDLPRIINYCQEDTIAVAQIILRFKNEDLLSKAEITYI